MRLLFLDIRICMFIKYDYYLLSTYVVIFILDYYPNLYASLNKLRVYLLHKFMIISHIWSLFHRVIEIWITQRKKKKKKNNKTKSS